MSDKNLTQNYHSQIYDNFLMHWKYIKREKVNGKWKYYYDDGEKTKGAAYEAKAAAERAKQQLDTINNTIKIKNEAILARNKAIVDAKMEQKALIDKNRTRIAEGKETLNYSYERQKAKNAQLTAEYGKERLMEEKAVLEKQKTELESKVAKLEKEAAALEKQYNQSPAAKGYSTVDKVKDMAINAIDGVIDKFDEAKAWVDTQMNKEDAIKEKVIPEQIIPEQIIPEQIIPEQIIPEQIIEEQTIPNKSIPVSERERKIIEEAERKSKNDFASTMNSHLANQDARKKVAAEHDTNVIPKKSDKSSADVTRDMMGKITANRKLTDAEVKDETEAAKKLFDSYFKTHHNISDAGEIYTQHVQDIDYATKKPTGTYTTVISLIKNDGTRLTLSNIQKSGPNASELGNDCKIIASEMEKYLAEAKKKKKK